mmetsp:Transcript_10086/g.24682  ORF Transcript_10086/g.24682 Transcript_10086/m.24682 type:complete len:249 (-) Transcript_10086:224-970(-)
MSTRLSTSRSGRPRRRPCPKRSRMGLTCRPSLTSANSLCCKTSNNCRTLRRPTFQILCSTLFTHRMELGAMWRAVSPRILHSRLRCPTERLMQSKNSKTRAVSASAPSTGQKVSNGATSFAPTSTKAFVRASSERRRATRQSVTCEAVQRMVSPVEAAIRIAPASFGRETHTVAAPRRSAMTTKNGGWHTLQQRGRRIGSCSLKSDPTSRTTGCSQWSRRSTRRFWPSFRRTWSGRHSAIEIGSRGVL